jgi:CheY-like chemotaxis protein
MSETRKSPIVSTGKGSPSHASESRPRVLVVDDECVVADTLAKVLTLSGYAAIAAYDADDALEIALHSPPELLITDVLLPGMNGIELAITIKRIFPDCKILLFSGQVSTAHLMAAAGREGHRFTLLNKPLPPKNLVAIVAEHLNTNSMKTVDAVGAIAAA